LIGLVATGWQWITAEDLERIEERLVTAQKTNRNVPDDAKLLLVDRA
jgi:hypothetical protein